MCVAEQCPLLEEINVSTEAFSSTAQVVSTIVRAKNIRFVWIVASQNIGANLETVRFNRYRYAMAHEISLEIGFGNSDVLLDLDSVEKTSAVLAALVNARPVLGQTISLTVKNNLGQYGIASAMLKHLLSNSRLKQFIFKMLECATTDIKDILCDSINHLTDLKLDGLKHLDTATAIRIMDKNQKLVKLSGKDTPNVDWHEVSMHMHLNDKSKRYFRVDDPDTPVLITPRVSVWKK